MDNLRPNGPSAFGGVTGRQPCRGGSGRPPGGLKRGGGFPYSITPKIVRFGSPREEVYDKKVFIRAKDLTRGQRILNEFARSKIAILFPMGFRIIVYANK